MCNLQALWNILAYKIKAKVTVMLSPTGVLFEQPVSKQLKDKVKGVGNLYRTVQLAAYESICNEVKN